MDSTARRGSSCLTSDDADAVRTLFGGNCTSPIARSPCSLPPPAHGATPRRLLRVLAPLGVLLPNGLGLNIDGTDMGRVAFVRCLPNGCVAEVVMDDALIKQLSEGSTAIFVVFKTPEEGIGIPVSLEGFKDGFANLP